MARDSQTVRVVAKNRRARHDYEILDTLECGIALVGTEVKSLRAGRASIGEAYGRIKAGELWLVGATIPEYSHGNVYNHVPARDRKLLVHARELRQWDKRVRERGVTLVPLTLYFKGHRVKLELALCRGKRHHDRREDQKKRGARREGDRAMSRGGGGGMRVGRGSLLARPVLALALPPTSSYPHPKQFSGGALVSTGPVTVRTARRGSEVPVNPLGTATQLPTTTQSLLNS